MSAPRREPSWEPPVPFGGLAGAGQEFPTDALPGWLERAVRAVAEATQVSPDMPAVLALAALGTAAGGHVVVEVSASWREPLNIFVAVVMGVGERKSAVVREMLTGPLIEAENALIEAAAPIIAEATVRREVADHIAREAVDRAKGRHKRKKENTSDGEVEDVIKAATEAALMAEAITVAPTPRLLVDDVTPEALASLLAAHGRIAVLSAEGGVFDMIAGRYSRGVPNLDVYLKGHAGDVLKVDRKGAPPEFVKSPALTIGITVQPAVLVQAAEQIVFRGRGLLARFLFSVPSSLVGRRQSRPAQVPRDVADAYVANLAALIQSLVEWVSPNEVVLTLSPDADRVLEAWQDELEPQLGEDGRLRIIGDWANKLAGETVRVAGLLHLAEHPADGWSKPIAAETMTAAIAIGRYFLEHALVAFDAMGTDETVVRARQLVRWFIRNHLTTFTERDAFRAHQAHFEKVDEMRPVLTLLETHAWVRRTAGGSTGRPGRRPSPQYDVNPLAFVDPPVTAAPQMTERAESEGSVSCVSSVTDPPTRDEDLLTGVPFDLARYLLEVFPGATWEVE